MKKRVLMKMTEETMILIEKDEEEEMTMIGR